MIEDASTRICASGRELHRQGLIGGVAGNLSVRLEDGSILITRAGTHKGHLEPVDLVTVGPAEGDPSEGASSELPLHRACYDADPSIGAVVHSHAPALTAVGLKDLAVPEHLPELELATGGWATIALLPSGSRELGMSVAEALHPPGLADSATGGAARAGTGVLLLRNHGAVTVGATLDMAMHRMELAELAAYTILLSEDGIAPGVMDRVSQLVARLSHG